MHARLTRRGWSNRLTRGVASALATCLSATVFTLPIVMLSFGEVSLVSPLANPLEAYPAGIMLLFGALAGVCSLIPALSFLASACSLIAGILANYLIFCVRCLAAVPSASIPMSERYLLLWLAGTLLLLGLACILGKGWRYKRCLLYTSSSPSLTATARASTLRLITRISTPAWA